MSINLSKLSQTVAIIEIIHLESKPYGENYNSKGSRGLPQRINLTPTTTLDTRIIRVMRDNIHPFPQHID